MEVMLALAMLSTAAIVISSVFLSNYMRIEAQGKETYLHEEIDRGITRLSDRLKGACKILPFEDEDHSDVLLRFEYYYRDSDKPFVGKLYLEGNILKLESIKDSQTKINTIMGYLDEFTVVLLNNRGNKEPNKEQVCAVKLVYKVSTEYRKIHKEKEGEVVIKLRNIGE